MSHTLRGVGASLVHEQFSACARHSPEAPAVTFEAESLTYRALELRANRLAHFLRRMGVGPDALVGIAVDRSVDFVVGILGILKAGGAYVPLDPSYPQERLAFMAADSGLSALVTHERWLSKLETQAAPVLCLDRDSEVVAGESGDSPSSGVTAENLAYVVYTSGSTGKPKGVAVSHRAVTRLVLNTDYLRIEAGHRIALASSICFDAATFEIWGALLNGACVVGLSQEALLSPRELGEALRGQGVTTLFLTSALLGQVVREDVGALSGLSHLLFGGETTDPNKVRDLLKARPARRLLHMYGPTETTTFATWHLVESLADQVFTVPIGRPIADTRAYVLDASLRPVAVGQAGELFIGGAGLARGYLRRPELTAENFMPDPFSMEPGQRIYRTGDLARWLPEGAIEFLGRRDHQVKLRGFRIELGEIESVLRQHPAVEEAAAIVREDAPGDRRLVAYVAVKPSAPLAGGALRSWLGGRLPEYLVPSGVIALQALPLNQNKKVDRRALAAAPLPSEATLSGSAPRQGLEDVIAAVWREVLRDRAFGIDDHFFDAGGNSLLLLRLRYGLEQALGRRLTVPDLLQHPTIRSLAAAMQTSARGGSVVAGARDRAVARRLAAADRPHLGEGGRARAK